MLRAASTLGVEDLAATKEERDARNTAANHDPGEGFRREVDEFGWRDDVNLAAQRAPEVRQPAGMGVRDDGVVDLRL